MLLVIPGRKLLLLLHALRLIQFHTRLWGIFKLMTLYLSSTETFNMIFQVDSSQWILATTALNKTHLTVFHEIFRWTYYWNVNFCYLITFFWWSIQGMQAYWQYYWSCGVCKPRSQFIHVYIQLHKWRDTHQEIQTKKLPEQAPSWSAELMTASRTPSQH